MAALTAPRNTLARGSDRFTFGVAAGVTIYAGGIACLNANGFLVPGATAPNLKAAGRAEHTVTGGAADGLVTNDVFRGIYQYANSAGADLIGPANVGSLCYVIDDQTVALTNPGGNTRSVAGAITGVDANGVWVRLSFF